MVQKVFDKKLVLSFSQKIDVAKKLFYFVKICNSQMNGELATSIHDIIGTVYSTIILIAF